MYCEKCGNYVAEGSRFCEKCGNPMPTIGGDEDKRSQGGNYVSGPSDNVNANALGSRGGINGVKILKWVALLLAVLTFIFHLLNQYEVTLRYNNYSYYYDYSNVREYFSLSFGDFGVIATYAVVVFALYLGFLFVGGRNRYFNLIRRVLQIAFFAIMFLAPIIFIARMGSLLGEANDLISGENVRAGVSLKAGWWFTEIFSLIGLVVSFIPEKDSAL